MLFLQYLYKGVDKILVKEVLPIIVAMKEANVEGKATLSKCQKFEDTSFDLINIVLSFGNICSQIENAKMAIQTSIEINKLKAQLSIHDLTLNQNKELASMKQ